MTTCDPSFYTMNVPKFIVSYQMEEPIGIQRVDIIYQAQLQVRCQLYWCKVESRGPLQLTSDQLLGQYKNT